MAALRVVYIYVGSADVEADLKFFVDGLGGELAWRFHEFGRMGDGPMYIVADHRAAGDALPIIAVDDLYTTAEALGAAGFSDLGTTVEVPDGPVMVLRAPAGNEVGLMHQVRPGALEHH